MDWHILGPSFFILFDTLANCEKLHITIKFNLLPAVALIQTKRGKNAFVFGENMKKYVSSSSFNIALKSV